MQETQETWIQSLSQEDPLEYEMATHSSNLAWKIPWTEEPGRLKPMELQRVGHGFGWTLGVGDGQGGLACCGSWGCKE